MEITIRGQSFEISAVVLHLDGPGAYPLLFGRPWLRTTKMMPLYTEAIHMLDELADEVYRYLEQNPKFMPLFEIDLQDRTNQPVRV